MTAGASVVFKATALASVVSLLVGAGGLFAYDRLVLRPALRTATVATVDLGEVFRAREAEFTRLLTRAATDSERERALAMARSFAQQLPLALQGLSQECACLVLIKSAVASARPGTIDLTERLRTKLEGS